MSSCLLLLAQCKVSRRFLYESSGIHAMVALVVISSLACSAASNPQTWSTADPGNPEHSVEPSAEATPRSADATPPIATIQYTGGTIATTAIALTISSSDPESGIVRSRIEYRRSPTAHEHIGDCAFTDMWTPLSEAKELRHAGTPGYCYQFRVHAENGAGMLTVAGLPSDEQTVFIDVLGAEQHAFIISDEDWRAVLSLVPVVIRKQNKTIRQRPLLLFHNEDSGFDADALLHFLEQYRPTRITLVGPAPAKLEDLIEAAAGKDASVVQSVIGDYADADAPVVYAKGYAASLVAATYASLTDAALVVADGPYDTPSNLTGRKITLVGTTSCPVGADCVASRTVRELQADYVAQSGTDDVTLVNPNDLAWTPLDEAFSPSRGTGKIRRIYDRTSLTAPILAAARQQVILFFDSETERIEKSGYCEATNIEPLVEAVRARLVADVAEILGTGKLDYLTIVAPPNAIPDSIHLPGGLCVTQAEHGQRTATDRTLIPGAKTGRIYGLSSSDVTAYMARSLHYNVLFDNTYGNDDYSGFILAASICDKEDPYFMVTSSQLVTSTSTAGYETDCQVLNIAPAPEGCEAAFGSTFDPGVLMRKQFIIAYSHGSPSGWEDFVTVDNLPLLDLPYVSSLACSTGYFWKATAGGKDVPRAKRFAPFLLRKGAMGYHGLLSPGSSTATAEIFLGHSSYLALGKLLTEPGTTLGELDLYMVEEMATVYLEPKVSLFALLGDPAFAPRVKQHQGVWPVVKPTRN